MLKVFIGYDGREPAGYEVALRSLLRNVSRSVRPIPLVTAHMRGIGLYWRPEEFREGIRYDVISNAPMSTEFALTRFLVPALCDFQGWALFVDCDFLFRADVAELFDLADESKAVQVVQHAYAPLDATKMDGQPQTSYPMKNWSSCILWNCAHPAHRNLDLDDINTVPGLKLHQFWWLAPNVIGALPEKWNWLEGHSDPAIEPAAVHYTRGTPDMPGHDHAAFANEWRAYLTNTQRKTA